MLFTFTDKYLNNSQKMESLEVANFERRSRELQISKSFKIGCKARSKFATLGFKFRNEALAENSKELKFGVSLQSENSRTIKIRGNSQILLDQVSYKT